MTTADLFLHQHNILDQIAELMTSSAADLAGDHEVVVVVCRKCGEASPLVVDTATTDGSDPVSRWETVHVESTRHIAYREVIVVARDTVALTVRG